MQALQTGLELARASQLTMLRLQLALHKSNRYTAMQALDHLLDIDAEMEDLAATLDSGPAYSAGDAPLSGFIRRQKAAIAVEKHALTGGDGRHDAASIAIAAHHDWADDDDPAAPSPFSDDEAGSLDRTSGRRWLHVLAIAIILVGVGTALWAWLSPALPSTLTSFLDLQ
jgi:hypothetical protein